MQNHNGNSGNGKSYKHYIQNQNEIRDRLFEVIKKNPKPLVKVAKEIGITRITFNRFFKEEKDVEFVALVKIENWINKMESNDGNKLDSD